eukprot:TRINITY_DN23085_c0_g1_i1.p1 TRINITY_DN23085_c0_g1~~TRINITY_DN23085_c0_g1_i1.p1  ORF type:complete len:551 (+),score=153.55 TRINITY_DN23085_c0_g1_i1:74-1726(+)
MASENVPVVALNVGEPGEPANVGEVAVAYGKWPPPEEVRQKLVGRISSNITALSFFQNKDLTGRINESVAWTHAKEIEAAAFEAGEKNEGGNDAETLAFYARVASEKLLEVIRSVPDATPAPEISPEEVFDISGGKREFLNKEMAEALLKPLLSSGQKFVKVKFSNMSFGKDAAGVAAAALRAVKEQLVDADLSDIIAGRPEGEALEVLEEICSALEGSNLRSLNLSDNALGEKGVRACGAALRGQTSLEHLYFCNNGISVEAAASIAELLPSSKKLKTLHFYNNMSGDDGAKALSKLVEEATVLYDFRFSSTRVATEGGLALATALLSGSSLRKLDFRDNMFSPQCGVALAKVCAKHIGLREVYFGDTGLGDAGAIAVAEALENGAPKLEVLDLAGNDISSTEAALAISMCVARKPTLKKLNLSENELGDQGVYVVCKAFRNRRDGLKELDFGCNDLKDIGAIAAAEAVAHKDGFEVLNLNSNRISAEGVEKVTAIMKEGKAGLKALAPLDDNIEDDESEEEEEDEEEGEGAEDEGAAELTEKVSKLEV